MVGLGVAVAVGIGKGVAVAIGIGKGVAVGFGVVGVAVAGENTGAKSLADGGVLPDIAPVNQRVNVTTRTAATITVPRALNHTQGKCLDGIPAACVLRAILAPPFLFVIGENRFSP